MIRHEDGRIIADTTNYFPGKQVSPVSVVLDEELIAKGTVLLVSNILLLCNYSLQRVSKYKNKIWSDDNDLVLYLESNGNKTSKVTYENYSPLILDDHPLAEPDPYSIKIM